MAKKPNIICPLFQKLVLYIQSRKLHAFYGFAKYQVFKVIKSALFLHKNIWHFTS